MADEQEDPTAVPVAHRLPGRLLRGGLLATAVATVVALDVGVVPLPYSTPRPAPTQAASSPISDPWTARYEGISRTLAVMTEGLRSGDEDLFASVADPASPQTERVLRQVFRNLRLLPDTEYEVTWGGRWDAAPGTPAPDPLDEVMVRVRVDTRIRGWDSDPCTDPQSVRMRRLGDRWVVSGWERGRDGVWMAEATPWSVGADLAVVATPHVLLVGERRNGRYNTRLAARLETAARDLKLLWSDEVWSGRTVVVAMTSPDYLDTIFTPGEAVLGGQEEDHFTVDRRIGPHQPYGGCGLRLVLANWYLLRDTAETRSSLHYALSYRALSGLVPYEEDDAAEWLRAGASVYASSRPGAVKNVRGTLAARGLNDATLKAVRAGRWKPDLPVYRGDFAEGDDADVRQDWDSAFLAALHIVDRYGEPALGRLALAAREAGGGEAGARIALREVLDTDEDAFRRDVARFARRMVSG